MILSRDSATEDEPLGADESEMDLYRNSIFYGKLTKLMSSLVVAKRAFVVENLSIHLMPKNRESYYLDSDREISRNKYYYDRQAKLLKLTWDFPLDLLLQKVLKENP